MKRTAVTIGILLALAYTAFAANIPPLTGPQDPSQLQATINQLVQSVNSNVGMPGYVGGLPAATTGTPTVFWWMPGRESPRLAFRPRPACRMLWPISR